MRRGRGLRACLGRAGAGNIGGGGFMLIRLANGKTTSSIYREVAPSKATRDMYIGKDSNSTKKPPSSLQVDRVLELSQASLSL